jgi:ABC-type antimicrobial peptide transport system permease subunit
MIRNYLKTALRHMRRNGLFTGLNVFGLATGLACSILIFLWVGDQESYDRFNPHAEKIFRLLGNVKETTTSGVPTAFAVAIKREVPEVKNSTHLYDGNKLMRVGTKLFEEKRVLCVDTNFLNIFNYPLVRGDKASVLQTLNSAVLTEATAIRYFGSVDKAMGRSVFDETDSLLLQVTGILKDVRGNSHLHFDLLLPENIWLRNMDRSQTWRYFDSHTYLQLADGVTPDAATLHALENRLKAIRDRAIVNTPAVPASWTLQALPDVHLRSHFKNDIEGQGNIEYVRLFSLIAVIILVIACINFMNLSTALSGTRAKEVGLRKTIGALRWQLIGQFIGESLLLALIALALALVLVAFAMPYFSGLSGKSITLNLLDPTLLGKAVGIAVLTGLLAGCYPALYLSGFNAVEVLKGARIVKGSFLRNGLVVLQFSISVVLIISTIVIYDQLRFLHNRDIGFDKNNLLYFRIANLATPGDGGAALRDEFRNNPAVADITCTWNLPTNLNTASPLKWRGMDRNTLVLITRIGGDDRYASTLGLKMAAGRFYSPGDGRDRYVINETAAKAMGVEPAAALGKLVTINDLEGPVIGVVKDFNFKPADQPIGPLVIKHDQTDDIFLVRPTPGNTRRVLAAIQSAFARYYGNAPFTYGFVDQDLDHLYQTEARMGSLFTIFSVLSIVISCLGLFGLATFATQRRTKEIGVRKILGADEAGIVFLLAREFLRLVAASLLFAFPIAWFAMHRWLDGFVYKIGISGWVFAAAGAMALLIAFITVSYQTIRTAMASPVRALRSE